MAGSERDDPSFREISAEVYQELRAIAAGQLGRERKNHTLQPTALVHEAYLKMGRQKNLRFENRLHFIRIAAYQIRQILVDYARSRGRLKRGGDRRRVTLVTDLADPGTPVDLIDLDDALNALDAFSSEARQIVELKFFGGLNESEIAEALGMSARTVRRRWVFARTWLYREMS
jgi:RNA polymerase sigma factor (TIGR02999 family)